MEKREKWLIENGFKKKWLDDKSRYWFEKHFKLGEFKCRFSSEEDFNFIEIETLYGFSTTRKQWEILWDGNWTQFKKKVEKYGKQ